MPVPPTSEAAARKESVMFELLLPTIFLVATAIYLAYETWAGRSA